MVRRGLGVAPEVAQGSDTFFGLRRLFGSQPMHRLTLRPVCPEKAAIHHLVQHDEDVAKEVSAGDLTGSHMKVRRDEKSSGDMRRDEKIDESEKG